MIKGGDYFSNATVLIYQRLIRNDEIVSDVLKFSILREKVINVERLGKAYPPSYTTPCNSRGKELKNKVIKLNYHVISFEERREEIQYND